MKRGNVVVRNHRQLENGLSGEAEGKVGGEKIKGNRLALILARRGETTSERV
jgi:hypothetical protein